MMDRLLAHGDMELVREFQAKLAGAQADQVCDFIDLVAQLRFQKRWTRIPRIPETSVLGHMFFVGLMGLLLSVVCGIPRERWGWNFFGGLLHDLPEALTRDVISPVKRQMGLRDLLAKLESDMMERHVYPLLGDPLAKLVRFLVEDEFSIRALVEGQKIILDGLDGGMAMLEAGQHSRDGYPVVDGPLLDLADKFSAFLEARFSIRCGVYHPVLEDAAKSIEERYRHWSYNSVELGQLFNLLSDK